MSKEDNDLIYLTDENGEAVPFEFLDLIDFEGDEYVVLLPHDEELEEEDGEVVILRVEPGDDEEDENYVSVDDEDTLEAVFQIFKDKFQDKFSFTD